MSTMKICPKCNSEQFKVNLVAEGVVSIAVTEAGNEYQLISQGDLGIDNSVLACVACGETFAEDVLVDGMMSDVSKKYFPITDLVQAETDNGPMIMTQAEYDAMTAPSIDEMNEEQLRETAKQQQSTLEQMQAQMAALMAQMQALQNGGLAQAAMTTPEPPKEEKKAKTTASKKEAPKAESAPAVTVQAPSIDTNIPAPESTGDANVIDPDTIEAEEIPAGDFFGAEAPF